MPFKELDEKTLTDTALYEKIAVYLSQEYKTAKDEFLALDTACNSISTLIQEARALHEVHCWAIWCCVHCYHLLCVL